jgi:hypothetical protein
LWLLLNWPVSPAASVPRSSSFSKRHFWVPDSFSSGPLRAATPSRGDFLPAVRLGDPILRDALGAGQRLDSVRDEIPSLMIIAQLADARRSSRGGFPAALFRKSSAFSTPHRANRF